MKICAVIKYPPIQGGVSAQSYWMMRGLAEAGHEVDVVTNSDSVEEDFRLQLTSADEPFLAPTFEAGRVRLHQLERFSRKLTHIPQSNPFVSRLAGLAAEVVRRQGSEILFSYYLEPYGVAAHLASAWTGVPQVVHHAGSDVGRLMNQQGLGTTYREVFRAASGICAGSAFPFLGLGADAANIYRDPPFYLPRDHFHPDAEPLDLAAHLASVEALRPDLVRNPGPLDPELPTLGIYGKMGEPKGSYDLLAALGRLKEQGRRFNFVAVTRGQEMERYLAAIDEHGLTEVTWLLPFMAHWRIPGFIRACDAVCFLERDFPIQFHTPSVAREVLACGTCLVLSGEIYRKQRFRDRMQDGENFLLVEDPKDHAALASVVERVLDDPAAARKLGRRGADLVADQDPAETVRRYAAIFEDVAARHRGEEGSLDAAQRAVPEGRRESLEYLAAMVLRVLGDDAEATLERYLESHPEDGAGRFDDARRFCRFVEDEAEAAGDRRRADAARYGANLIWLGHLDEREEQEPPFLRRDAMARPDRTRWSMEELAPLAPLASRWLKIESFQELPPGVPGGGGDDPSGTVVFHKTPNANGHHFLLRPKAAELLTACDGSVTVPELAERFTGGRGGLRPLMRALRRFYREGMIIFVEPRPAPAGPGAVED